MYGISATKFHQPTVVETSIRGTCPDIPSVHSISNLRPAISEMKQRDSLIDLWRGLALVDMVWVHLAYTIGLNPSLVLWIGEYTRFAAGAFVLIAGISVARVFGPKLVGSPELVRATRWRLLRRALLLALLDRLVAVGYVLIAQFRLAPPTAPASDHNILALLCFDDPGVTGGLLFLYALLLVATPLLDVAWRRFGGVVLVAASLGVFALAHAPDGGVAHWPFPVLHWQPLFVIGYALSRPLARWHESGGRVSAPWLLMSTAAFVFVFLVRNPAALGFPLSLPLGDLAFVKVPLSPAEMIWYLAASGFWFAWSAWLWNQAAGQGWSCNWLRRLGRQSLLVYVAHLLIEPPILELVTLVAPPLLVRTALLPLTVVLLVTVAVAGERVKRTRSVAPVPLAAPRWVPIGGLMGSAVAAGAVGAIITLQVVIGPPANWNHSLPANILAQEALSTDEALVSTTEENTIEESAPLVDSLDGGEPDLFYLPQEGVAVDAVTET